MGPPRFSSEPVSNVTVFLLVVNLKNKDNVPGAHGIEFFHILYGGWQQQNLEICGLFYQKKAVVTHKLTKAA